MSLSVGPFYPHPLVRGGNLQTIVAHFSFWADALRPDEVLTFQMPDHDQIAIDLNMPARTTSRTPVVILFHGLGGSADSKYVVRIAKKLNAVGFRTARFNHRGCAPYNELTAKNIYHTGSLEDLRAGVVAVKNRWPRAPIIVAGFSLSGAILLNLLGREPDIDLRIPNLRKAIAICPPIDLEGSSQAISELKNRHYDLYYTKHLVRTASRRKLKYPGVFNPTLPRGVNLRTFDELFTARLGGFKSRDDYYETCSPGSFVDKICLPTTVIAAADDPIVPIATVTRAHFSDAVTLRVEKSGGHMGFLSSEKTRFGDYRWMDEAVVTWAEQLFVEEAKRHSEPGWVVNAQGDSD